MVMWKRFLMLALCLPLALSAGAARPRKKRTPPPSGLAEAAAPVEAKPEDKPSEAALPPREAFENCMDNMCYDGVYEEKGRCPCSDEISRIEKVLATIDDLQDKADKESAALEDLLEGEKEGNKGGESTFFGSLSELAVEVGKNPTASAAFRLGERSFETCVALAPKASNEEKDKWLKVYMNKVDADCANYAAMLKERADGLVSFYLQVKKNREIYDEQEKNRHDAIDDPTLCYMEYEACALEECGEKFKGCKNSLKLRAMLQKCQAMNKGKCDSQKMVVIDRLRSYILLELK
jgi:hypothetical protein